MDLVNDISFIARESDKIKNFDRSIIDVAGEGILSGHLPTVGNVPFNSGEKLLALMQRVDPCNSSGAISAALNAMHSIQSLMSALSSVASMASIEDFLTSGIADALNGIAGGLMGAASSVLSSLQDAASLLSGIQHVLSDAAGTVAGLVNELSTSISSIAGLMNGLAQAAEGALLAALCAAPCGDSIGGGGSLSPLAALAALAGMSLSDLAGIVEIPLLIEEIANAAAYLRTNGQLNGFSQECLRRLTDRLMGNFNPCGLLGALIGAITAMTGQDAFVGDPNNPDGIKMPSGTGAFSFMMTIMNMIKKIRSILSSALGALDAITALDEALSCSGYTPFTQRDYTPPVYLSNNYVPKGVNGGPGGSGGDVGGGGGFDNVNATINVAVSSISNTSGSVLNTYHTSDNFILANNVPRNMEVIVKENSVVTPLDTSQFNNSQGVIPVQVTSNSVGVVDTLQFGTNILFTNIPRKTK